MRRPCWWVRSGRANWWTARRRSDKMELQMWPQMTCMPDWGVQELARYAGAIGALPTATLYLDLVPDHICFDSAHLDSQEACSLLNCILRCGGHGLIIRRGGKDNRLAPFRGLARPAPPLFAICTPGDLQRPTFPTHSRYRLSATPPAPEN